MLDVNNQQKIREVIDFLKLCDLLSEYGKEFINRALHYSKKQLGIK